MAGKRGVLGGLTGKRRWGVGVVGGSAGRGREGWPGV